MNKTYSKGYNLKNVVIVIPIYREVPSDDEKISICNIIHKIGNDDIQIVAPHELDISYYIKVFSNVKVINMPKRIWKRASTYCYNQMCLNPSFYNMYAEYRFMLIAQTDCLLIKGYNTLIDFCNMNFDYIGGLFNMNTPIYAMLPNYHILCSIKKF